MISTSIKYMFMLLALLFTACADNDMFFSDGETVNMKFTATLSDGNMSRDGVAVNPDVNQLYYTIYKAQPSGVDWIHVAGGTAQITGSQITTEGITLVKNQVYRVVFWAQKDNYFIAAPAAGEYPVLGTLQLDDDKLAGNADAFYASTEFTATGGVTAVTLKRPFSQFNFYTTAESLTSSTLNVTFDETLYNSFNIITGNAEGKSTVQNVTTNVAVESTTETINGETVRRFAKFFVLAPANSDNGVKNVGVTFSLSEGGGETYSVTAPWQQNYCVRIAGNVVEATAWDGVTFTAPKTTPDKCSVTGFALHVESPDQLAYLLKNGTTATTIHICSDMDMGGHALNTVANLPDNATISGIAADGATKHVIKNLNLNDVQGLFGGTANNLKINNLEIGGVTLNSSSVDNAGVLLGKATGSLEMTNVTVDGCTVNGKRNVGGMVGYADGNATFAGCVSRNVTTTATGDPATVSTSTDYKTTGAVVGVFKGNAEGETLTFDANCSVEGYTGGAGAYIAANQSCWVAGTLDTKFDNALGNEEFCRGTVTYGGVRIVPHWDGIRKVAPIGTAANGTVSTCEIWSPFDLAYLQGKSLTSVTFKSDVDMDGKGDDEIANIPSNFPSAQVSSDDKLFTPINSIATLDGQNKTLYNLSVSIVGGNAAFISNVGNGEHWDFNIDGANIVNVHNPNIRYPQYYGDIRDYGQGNAYAGGFICGVTYASTSYSATNIHVKNSKVFGVCKMGVLIGRAIYSNMNVTGCSVDNCYLENYNPLIPNFYSFGSEPYSVASWYVDVLQWWYTCGEVGGLIGFVKCNSATIDKCSVINTDLNCVGQEDKEVRANVYNDKPNPRFENGVDLFAYGHTVIAGRHVNQFIGEVVSERPEGASTGYDVAIKDYYVSNNTYLSGKNHHKYDNSNECEVIGSAYYIGVNINVAGLFSVGHVKDIAGSLTFTPKGGSSKTLTEDPKNGDGLAWTGGNFQDYKLGAKTDWVQTGKYPWQGEFVWNAKSSFPADPGYDYWDDGKGSR